MLFLCCISLQSPVGDGLWATLRPDFAVLVEQVELVDRLRWSSADMKVWGMFSGIEQTRLVCKRGQSKQTQSA